MNTRLIAEEYRLTHWSGIMRERVESGLSIKAFCEKAGFHENSYFYWQRKLREAAFEQFTDVQAAPAPTGLVTRGFTEVKISERQLLPSPPLTAQGEIRIEAGGARITADSMYPPAKLVELIKGLSLC